MDDGARGGSTERARVAVGKAIAAAIDRIFAVDAETGAILRRCVTTGSMCRFDAEFTRPTRWLTDEQQSSRRPVRGADGR